RPAPGRDPDRSRRRPGIDPRGLPSGSGGPRIQRLLLERAGGQRAIHGGIRRSAVRLGAFPMARQRPARARGARYSILMKAIRLTTAQAAVSFLKNQYVERDGRETPFFAGAWGIFGHGNVAGIGQALRQEPGFPYYLCRNEQAMTHTAMAYAKMKNRLQTFACTTSIGPGATNMVTGAACATINRIPLLLLPGDIFARRNVGPVLQQLESDQSQDVSVNDVFKP